jgi:hypothetical protein
LLLFEDLAMILTSNTRLTDWIAEWLGRRLARYLAQPVKDFVPLATANPGAFLRALRPGDIVLVEGNTRVSTAIKYLTQSTCPIRRSMSGRFQVGANRRESRMSWSRLMSSMGCSPRLPRNIRARTHASAGRSGSAPTKFGSSQISPWIESDWHMT